MRMWRQSGKAAEAQKWILEVTLCQFEGFREQEEEGFSGVMDDKWK